MYHDNKRGEQKQGLEIVSMGTNDKDALKGGCKRGQETEGKVKDTFSEL